MRHLENLRNQGLSERAAISRQIQVVRTASKAVASLIIIWEATMTALQPRCWYRGRDALGRAQYLVAEFPNVVVAESFQKGNAVYIVHASAGDWRTILRRSKREALRLGAQRLIHDPDGRWRDRLRRLVREDDGDGSQLKPAASRRANPENARASTAR